MTKQHKNILLLLLILATTSSAYDRRFSCTRSIDKTWTILFAFLLEWQHLTKIRQQPYNTPLHDSTLWMAVIITIEEHCWHHYSPWNRILSTKQLCSGTTIYHRSPDDSMCYMPSIKLLYPGHSIPLLILHWWCTWFELSSITPTRWYSGNM